MLRICRTPSLPNTAQTHETLRGWCNQIDTLAPVARLELPGRLASNQSALWVGLGQPSRHTHSTGRGGAAGQPDVYSEGFVGYMAAVQVRQGAAGAGEIGGAVHERPAIPPPPDEWAQIDRLMDEQHAANDREFEQRRQKQAQQAELLQGQVNEQEVLRSERQQAEQRYRQNFNRAAQDGAAEEARRTAVQQRVHRERERAAREESVEAAQAKSQRRQLTRQEEAAQYHQQAAAAASYESSEQQARLEWERRQQQEQRNHLDGMVAEQQSARRQQHAAELKTDHYHARQAAMVRCPVSAVSRCPAALHLLCPVPPFYVLLQHPFVQYGDSARAGFSRTRTPRGCRQQRFTTGSRCSSEGCSTNKCWKWSGGGGWRMQTIGSRPSC